MTVTVQTKCFMFPRRLPLQCSSEGWHTGVAGTNLDDGIASKERYSVLLEFHLLLFIRVSVQSPHCSLGDATYSKVRHDLMQ